jgi:Outer membrane protein beta-barrel domain
MHADYFLTKTKNVKKVFLFAAMASGSSIIKAQTHVELGLKGGLNVAKLSTSSSSANVDPRISFNLGALAHIHISKEFAVQPELLFSGQGAKQTISNVVYKTNLNYVQVPVLLQYMIGTGFRLQTGPQIGFLASAKNKAGDITTDVKNNYKKVDVGWAFGAGYLTTSGFGIDARYNLGLSKINDNNGAKISNRVFSFGVFYQFKPMKHL